MMVLQYAFNNLEVAYGTSKREFMPGDIENLPRFLRIEVFDGECVSIEKVKKKKDDNESFCFSIYIDIIKIWGDLV